MKKRDHFGIVLNNNVNKKDLVKKILTGNAPGQLNLFNKQSGLLFSDLAIADFIDEEHKHHSIEITKEENRQLQTFSSGERRKAFLKYCIAQNPDYIIFDNPFDHLDQLSRAELSERLVELSNHISIIQLEYQTEKILPFIVDMGYVEDNSFVISKVQRVVKDVNTISKSKIPSYLFSIKEGYNNIIEFGKVSVSYGDKPIIRDITWEIKKGEFWQLIGPNGSGKSTILSLITGDNPKAYGQNITIFGNKKGGGESIWDTKKKIGQFSTNLTELFKRNHTVEQMILSGFFDSIGLYKLPSDLQRRKVEQWLKLIDMSHLKTTYFNRLSIGQQRLILIVRALVKQPPLLILDEPIEGLDAENTNLVTQLVNTLIERTEITIIYVSHTVETSLNPTNIYQLTPTDTGSTGKVIQ